MGIMKRIISHYQLTKLITTITKMPTIKNLNNTTHNRIIMTLTRMEIIKIMIIISMIIIIIIIITE